MEVAVQVAHLAAAAWAEVVQVEAVLAVVAVQVEEVDNLRLILIYE